MTEGVATATSDYQPWHAGSAYDAAGQAVGKTDAQQSQEGLTTGTTLDKLGRSTSEKAERDQAPSEPETTTTFEPVKVLGDSAPEMGVDRDGASQAATAAPASHAAAPR